MIVIDLITGTEGVEGTALDNSTVEEVVELTAELESPAVM